MIESPGLARSMPLLAVLAMACGSSVLRVKEETRNQAMNQAMISLQAELDRVGGKIDPNTVNCDRYDNNDEFGRNPAFFNLMMDYFQKIGGKVEESIFINAGVYLLVKIGGGYKVFESSSFAARYFKGVSPNWDIECTQAVSRDGDLAKYVQEVRVEGDPRVWFQARVDELQRRF